MKIAFIAFLLSPFILSFLAVAGEPKVPQETQTIEGFTVQVYFKDLNSNSLATISKSDRECLDAVIASLTNELKSLKSLLTGTAKMSDIDPTGTLTTKNYLTQKSIKTIQVGFYSLQPGQTRFPLKAVRLDTAQKSFAIEATNMLVQKAGNGFPNDINRCETPLPYNIQDIEAKQVLADDYKRKSLQEQVPVPVPSASLNKIKTLSAPTHDAQSPKSQTQGSPVQGSQSFQPK